MARRVSRRLVGVPLLWGAIGLAIGLAGPASAAGGEIPVLPATGVVDGVMAGYLAGAIAEAARAGDPAVVIELDTPGGSLDATHQIVSALLEAPLPTIVWVAPAGGRAASAGTFITLAANLAYMAPGTNIGAASPIDASGQDIGGTLGLKVRNDAMANIRSIAEARGRNVDWAVSTVATAVSSSASEAVALHAVDGLAATLEDVRTAANGRTVTVAGGRQVTLDLTGATFVERGMDPVQLVLHLLADPNIAFILLILGAYGLLLELVQTNFVSGVLGAVAVVLAFYGFGSLPLNLVGLLLIGLAIVLLGVDLRVTNHGLPTAGGLVAFVLGAAALYGGPPSNPFAPSVSVALPVIAALTVTSGAFAGLIVIGALRSRDLVTSPGTIGSGIPLGTAGEVRRPLDPSGSIHINGEEWTARVLDGRPLGRGTLVRVVGIDGLTVLVEPAPPAAAEQPRRQ